MPKLETIAVHAGHSVDPTTGAVAPPIHLSTTFEREADGSYRAGYVYTRYANPNRDALERALAALEGGAVAAAFASGQAATAAVYQALSTGDHVVVAQDAYFGSIKLLIEQFARWGLACSLVDMMDLDGVRAAIRPTTRLVWMETPSNPLLNLCDIGAIAEIAHSANAVAIVDNTWATPVLQQPLSLGADLVMHSTTKYIGGHSDVLGGAIISRTDDEFFQRVRAVQGGAGAVPAPFDCWLTLRGVATLPWRVRAHSDNARRLAEFLASHPAVEVVHYPGLASHPQHALARAQMRGGFGGMLSVQIRGDAERARHVASSLEFFTQATSLGGVESLVEHRHSVEGPNTRAPENLLRVSVGLEHPDDLVADWRRVLDSLPG